MQDTVDIRGIEEPASNIRWWKVLLYQPHRALADEPYAQLLLDWCSLVMHYSERRLTYDTDRLVAISGLTRDMCAMLEELRPGTAHRYLAGLREEEMTRMLLWSAREAGFRHKTYITPSWSWASLDGRFDMEDFLRPYDYLATLVSSDMRYHTGDDMGAIEYGAITLKCLSAKVVINQHAPDSRRSHETQLSSVRGRQGRVICNVPDTYRTRGQESSLTPPRIFSKTQRLFGSAYVCLVFTL